MTEQITIAGQVFNAEPRYEEGHELTANEAAALNQTMFENLRNNFAKKVKDAVEANTFDPAASQAEFTAYAGSYQFGIRIGGGGATRDPVMSEALRIAKAMISAALKKAGRKIGDVDPKAVNEKAKALVQSDEKIMDLAKQRVAEAQAAAKDDLSGLIADIPNAPADAPAA